MVIELHLQEGLKRYAPTSDSGVVTVDVPDGITVLELLKELEINPGEIRRVTVNKHPVNFSYLLEDGDWIELSAAG